jgi:thymidine phosphorylase
LTAIAHGLEVNALRLRKLGIDTYQEPVIYMSQDCPICRSEGWNAETRLVITMGKKSIIATLNVVTSGLLEPHEASLSDSAWNLIGGVEGATVLLSHAPALTSFSFVRKKLYGNRLQREEFDAIIKDVADGRFSDIELAAFVAGCSGGRIDFDEIVSLTRAMVDVGEKLSWDSTLVLDKHSVGGLPGNRTTMLVVPIVAAAGLVIPKTSSRAITSPSGTADAMEVVAPVALDIATLRRIVDTEGGCIAWGGSVRLSPADDVIIRVERPLDLDSEGQLVASVLSKKVAAGSTDVVIDMPVGATAKVRTPRAAASLAKLLTSVGKEVDLHITVLVGDGAQPIGRGIGPALEARDVLSVLRGEPDAPIDLKARALELAAKLIETGQGRIQGSGVDIAREILDSGKALRKFEAICHAQGGFREPQTAAHTRVIEAKEAGQLESIDNRRLARAAKLAGAPASKSAGLEMHVRLGDDIAIGRPLSTLHAESPGELEYAAQFVAGNIDMFRIQERTS